MSSFQGTLAVSLTPVYERSLKLHSLELSCWFGEPLNKLVGTPYVSEGIILRVSNGGGSDISLVTKLNKNLLLPRN